MLLLCELIFSNGIVERIFSVLKVIRTDKHLIFQLVSMLRDLSEIKVEGPTFDDFRPRPAVELWWKDCKTTRRSNQLPRKEYYRPAPQLQEQLTQPYRTWQNIPVEVMIPPYFPWRNGIHGLRIIAKVMKMRLLLFKIYLL